MNILDYIGLCASGLSIFVAAACALWYYKKPSAWPFLVFFIYGGVLATFSMYIESLPPPCQARGDCAATQAKGIYTGENHD